MALDLEIRSLLRIVQPYLHCPRCPRPFQVDITHSYNGTREFNVTVTCTCAEAIPRSHEARRKLVFHYEMNRMVHRRRTWFLI